MKKPFFEPRVPEPKLKPSFDFKTAKGWTDFLQYVFVYSVCFLPALIFVFTRNIFVVFLVGFLSGIWSVFWWKFAFKK